MSRTLSYRTGQSQDLKVGDTETELELICKDDDSPTDLSEAVTIQIKLGNYLGYLKSLSVSTNVIDDMNTNRAKEIAALNSVIDEVRQKVDQHGMQITRLEEDSKTLFKR